MTSQEFEKVLKQKDERFTVIDNPNRAGLSNIFFEGKNYDLPVIATHEIKDEVDMGYRYEFPNGMMARFWSQGEILARVDDFLATFNEKKDLYKDDK